MSTSGYDEAIASRNIKILHDLTMKQLKMAPVAFKNLLMLVCGDQMTISRLRTLAYNTKDDLLVYDCHSWVVPLIQLWHLKWTYLKGIMKCHWSPIPGNGTTAMRLRHDAEVLGQKINPDKCDYYPTCSLVETVYKANVLDCARCI